VLRPLFVLPVVARDDQLLDLLNLLGHLILLPVKQTTDVGLGPQPGASTATAFNVRSADGSPFNNVWYGYDTNLSAAVVAELEATRLTDVIRRNTGITRIQSNAFYVIPESDVGLGRTAGADAMEHALIGVAHANHLPIGRWTFRHGSIEERVARLYSLAGESRNRTWIDRRVRWIKVAIAVLGIGLGVWMALGG